jgi:hypothetical protein
MCESEMPLGQYGPVDLIQGTVLGYGVLAGGIDNDQVPRPSHTMSGVSSLVWQNIAAEVAGHVMEVERADGHPLLQLVTPDTEDEDTIRAQLAALHLRLYGETDEAAVDQTLMLFRHPLAGDTPAGRWQFVLNAMFRDARMIFY